MWGCTRFGAWLRVQLLTSRACCSPMCNYVMQMLQPPAAGCSVQSNTTHAAAGRPQQRQCTHSSRYGQLPSSSCRMSRYSSVRPWLRLTQMGWLRSLLKQAVGRTGELGHWVQQAGRCKCRQVSGKAGHRLLPGKHTASLPTGAHSKLLPQQAHRRYWSTVSAFHQEVAYTYALLWGSGMCSMTWAGERVGGRWAMSELAGKWQAGLAAEQWHGSTAQSQVGTAATTQQSSQSTPTHARLGYTLAGPWLSSTNCHATGQLTWRCTSGPGICAVAGGRPARSWPMLRISRHSTCGTKAAGSGVQVQVVVKKVCA